MAQARSGPPPVPPRVDLGETEDPFANNISDGLQSIDPTSDLNTQEAVSVAADAVTKDVPAMAPKPLHSSPPKRPIVVDTAPNDVATLAPKPSRSTLPKPSVVADTVTKDVPSMAPKPSHNAPHKPPVVADTVTKDVPAMTTKPSHNVPPKPSVVADTVTKDVPSMAPKPSHNAPHKPPVVADTVTKDVPAITTKPSHNAPPKPPVVAHTVRKDVPSMAPKPSHNAPPKPPVVAKPHPPTIIKANKPKLKETKGRPEISIISAQPMDQPSSATSTDQRGIPTPEIKTNDNNNSFNQPVTLPRADNKTSTVENKRHNPAPRAAAKKTGDAKKSVFYVDTDPEENISQGGITQVAFSKTDDSLSVKVKPRKSKGKPEQPKKTIEPVTSINRTQPEAPVSKSKAKNPVEAEIPAKGTQPEATISKPKPKPTIITSKKPKSPTLAKETKGRTSLKEAPSLDKNTSSIPVDVPAGEIPPGRPNVPPSAEVNDHSLETAQPERPKAPPNAAHEDQKASGPVKKKGERQKNPQPTQKRPKSKPPRPPMSKDGARTRPNRPAPAQPNVTSKKSPQGNVQAQDRKANSGVADQKPSKPSGPPRATAKFDYNSETADDLSFKVGDTIMLISKVDDDWLVGYLETNVMHQGLFPASFVDVVVPLKDIPEEKAEVPLEPYAVALHDFQGQSDCELSFSSGQTIILIERVNEEWLKGKVNQVIGIFPQNFVHVERDLPKLTVNDHTVIKLPSNNEANDETPSGEWCRATHDYHGNHEDDLSFVVGNEIRITEKIDNDWFRGVLAEKTGIFPASFVEIISQVNKTSTENTFVTAVHDYHSETAEDLSFCAGDKIKVVERINSDWLLGELNGKEGLFPVSFVENVPDSLPQPSTVNRKEENGPKNTRYVKAIHDFSGEHPGELHFQAGDIIEVVRDIDSSWCEGLLNNMSGIFPTSFVEPFQPQETWAKALYDYEGETPHDLPFKVTVYLQRCFQSNESSVFPLYMADILTLISNSSL